MTSSMTVGVLGGMGSAAAAEFFQRLVVATPAASDQEHLHVLIDNDPSVPNRTNAILHGGPSPVPHLTAMAKRLEAAGADFLVMPCNTAHVYISEIRASVSIPALDMIGEAVAGIDRASIGLLATDGTIQSGLYQDACDVRGIRVVLPGPEDQRLVMAAIGEVKRGKDPQRIGEELVPIVRRLERDGAEAVIAGCTEISLVDGAGMPIDCDWIDALDRLVEATVRHAWKRHGKEAE